MVCFKTYCSSIRRSIGLLWEVLYKNSYWSSIGRHLGFLWEEVFWSGLLNEKLCVFYKNSYWLFNRYSRRRPIYENTYWSFIRRSNSSGYIWLIIPIGLLQGDILVFYKVYKVLVLFYKKTCLRRFIGLLAFYKRAYWPPIRGPIVLLKEDLLFYFSSINLSKKDLLFSKFLYIL